MMLVYGVPKGTVAAYEVCPTNAALAPRSFVKPLKAISPSEYGIKISFVNCDLFGIRHGESGDSVEPQTYGFDLIKDKNRTETAESDNCATVIEEG